MEKEQYYSISKKLNLPKRCPIFQYCNRRAWTTFFLVYSKWKNGETLETLVDNGYLSQNFFEKEIKTIGEFTEFCIGDDFFWIRDACPELSLFDSTCKLPIIDSKAISNASYCKDFKTQTWRSEFETYKHFSECQEFSSYAYENKLSSNRPKKQRSNTRKSTISKILRFEIFQRDEFTCQYCGKTKEDNISLEIDHIIPYSKGGTDDYSNLITACNVCNSGKTDKIIKKD